MTAEGNNMLCLSCLDPTESKKKRSIKKYGINFFTKHK